MESELVQQVGWVCFGTASEKETELTDLIVMTVASVGLAGVTWSVIQNLRLTARKVRVRPQSADFQTSRNFMRRR
jgi:ammonia channel protein AmtB